MFGLLRTTLALMVMAFHLCVNLVPLGAYSVYGFYVISGYLMTLTMHGTYGYTAFGRYSFAVNRFLRLYPQYWIAAILSLVLIQFVGEPVARNFHPSMYVPASIESVLANLTMIYPAWHTTSVNPRLVPPTWALTVELFFYFLICLGLSKTFFRVQVWFVVSILYVVVSFLLGHSWVERYLPVAAASLPFSMGAAVYFLARGDGPRWLLAKLTLPAPTLFVMFIVNCIAWMLIYHLGLLKPTGVIEIGFYLSMAICAGLVYSLAKGDCIARVGGKIDKAVGDLSYPIYLLHWQIGLGVSYLVFGQPLHEMSERGFISFLVSVMVVVPLSLLLETLIDRPVQALREKVKANRRLPPSQISRPVEP